MDGFSLWKNSQMANKFALINKLVALINKSAFMNMQYGTSTPNAHD